MSVNEAKAYARGLGVELERLRTTMPSPKAWPVCVTVEKNGVVPCGIPYVLRRCWTLGKGWTWLWQRDCKHRRGGSVQPHNADGPCGEASAA